MLSRQKLGVIAVIAFLASACVCAVAYAQSSVPRPDLADIAAGIYDGDVISDARGSSRSNVRLTVIKTGPNVVTVTTRAMNTIQKVGGPEVFLLDLSKRPVGLDVTVADASWSGARSN
jgi:hypothetical protein